MGVTRAAVLARISTACILSHAAVFPFIAQGTHAAVIIDAIHTCASILAWVTGTVINIGLAELTSEAWLTVTQYAVAQIEALATCRKESRLLTKAMGKGPSLHLSDLLSYIII